MARKYTKAEVLRTLEDELMAFSDPFHCQDLAVGTAEALKQFANAYGFDYYIVEKVHEANVDYLCNFLKGILYTD